MKVELIHADNQDIIANLFQYYIYDMSEYAGWGPDATGLYKPDLAKLGIDAYWEREDHHPYLIKADGELAGFSLLRSFPDEPLINDIGQFFVLRKFKGKGVGRQAFEQSVSRFPGFWLTRVRKENTGALDFWTKLIGQRAIDEPEVNLEMYGELEMYFIRYQVALAGDFNRALNKV